MRHRHRHAHGSRHAPMGANSGTEGRGTVVVGVLHPGGLPTGGHRGLVAPQHPHLRSAWHVCAVICRPGGRGEVLGIGDGGWGRTGGRREARLVSSETLSENGCFRTGNQTQRAPNDARWPSKDPRGGRHRGPGDGERLEEADAPLRHRTAVHEPRAPQGRWGEVGGGGGAGRQTTTDRPDSKWSNRCPSMK